MAQSGYTPILIYASGTATNVPLAANMTSSASGAELALNYADGKLYFNNSSGVVTLLASSSATGGTFTTLSSTGNTTLGDASADTVTVNGTTTFNASPIISVTDNTNAALRITQLGTGNALLVEDSTNPDASPTVIGASGEVVIGGTTRFTTATTGSSLIQVAGSESLCRFLNDAAPTRLEFIKSRNTTFGNPSVIIQINDSLGEINFQGSDGAAFIRAAEITVAVDGTPGVNNMPGRLVFSTTADGASSPTERMRIDSSGNVGMGTTSLTTARLNVTNTVTDTGNSESAVFSIMTANNASGSNIKIGNRSSVLTGASFAGTGILNAYRADITYSLASAYSNSLQGFRTSITNSGAGAVNGVISFASTNPANTGGGSITNFYGFSQDDVTTATNVYGFLGTVASGANKFNLYMNGTANNYLAGRLGIGSTGLTDALVPCAINPTGATTMYGFRQFGTIQSDVTTEFIGYQTAPSTQAAAFTLTNLRHFLAGQGTRGASSAITNQFGFQADSSLTGATNNYGFYSDIASGTGRWNFYAVGTADNYFAGNLLVGTTSTSGNAGIQILPSAGNCLQTINHITGSASGSAYLYFNFNGSSIGSITQNGTTAVLYNTTSDYRLKTVIGPVANAGQRIDALQPVEYTWNASGERTRGFLAHQFAEVYASSVSGIKDAVDAEGKPKYQAMQASTSEVIADLVAEIQSLRQRLAAAGI